mmetsp:Transcript_116895/g.212692  ORF Transcript_116895/g.212692 Transcript_116895/m.212692 type:complete len:803 (-) Transcript_116895:103-2511(-)
MPRDCAALFFLAIATLRCLSTSANEPLVQTTSQAGAGDCQHSGVCPAADGRPLEDGAADDAIESFTELAALKQLNTKLSVGSFRRVTAANALIPAVALAASHVARNTTVPSAQSPGRAAKATGVTLNKAGDLGTFLSGLASNIAMIVVEVAIFMILAARFPMKYSDNVLKGIAPFTPPSGAFGWARASLKATTQEVADSVGLDNAMLLVFAQLCMRTLAMFGLPMLLIIGPLNCAFGGNAAGKVYLSYLSIGNVENGSWLFWIHAFLVWAVVIVVQVNLYSAMRTFLPRRHRWLQNLPIPRATTVMVENIPVEYQTEAKLKDFFGQLFAPSKIKSTYIVKRAPLVKNAFNRKVYSKSVLSSLTFQWEKTGRDEAQRPKSMWRGVDQIQYYTEEFQQASVALKLERTSAKAMLKDSGGINGCNGFVTFHDAKDAEFALGARQYGSDLTQWQVSVPPPPASILWHDLEQDPGFRAFWRLLGYLLTLGLYCIYLPSVIWITDIANQITLPGVLHKFWASLAPTLGLQFMVAFLPTFLILIFRNCFTLVDDAWAQQSLQNWYFVFQLVFVILVVAVGQSLFVFMEIIFTSPLSIFELLADTMPPATHFYMNFVVTTWTSHASVLMRMSNVCKFLLFSRIYEEEEAVKLSEPEDQDYYGLGSRHARFSTIMSIGIIFGQLCPPIPILVCINFCICRLVYGYLIPFAETKKPDLGGEFFVHACKHLFISCVVYCLLMAGVLFGRAADSGPGIIAVLCIPYVLWSMYRFDTLFSHEKLSFEQLITTSDSLREADGKQYIQPEWIEDDEE